MESKTSWFNKEAEKDAVWACPETEDRFDLEDILSSAAKETAEVITQEMELDFYDETSGNLAATAKSIGIEATVFIQEFCDAGATFDVLECLRLLFIRIKDEDEGTRLEDTCLLLENVIREARKDK